MVSTSMPELTQPTASTPIPSPPRTNFFKADSSAPEEPADALAQGVGVERLRLEGVRALPERDARAARPEARRDEYRGRGKLGRRAHAAYEVDAVGRGHPNVRDDEVGALLQRQLEAARAVVRDEHAVAVALKRHTHQLAPDLVVLDHQNLLHTLRAASHAAALPFFADRAQVAEAVDA